MSMKVDALAIWVRSEVSGQRRREYGCRPPDDGIDSVEIPEAVGFDANRLLQALDPKWFGNFFELQRGNVVRKVTIRVSIIDESTLKEIERRRNGVRAPLTRFTFPLAECMRWMQNSARKMFESELKRVDTEGQERLAKARPANFHASLDIFDHSVRCHRQRLGVIG